MLYGKGGDRDDGRGRSWYGVGDGQCFKVGGPMSEGATTSVSRAVTVAVTVAGATTSAVWATLSGTTSGVVFTLWV